MAEGKVNPEIGKLQRVNLNKPKDPSRRQALKGLGLLTAATVLSPLAKWMFGGGKTDEHSQVKVSAGSRGQVPHAETARIATELKQFSIPFEMVFGSLPEEEKEKAAKMVAQEKEFWRTRDDYEQLLGVVKDHERLIRQAAKDADFPEELALGIIFVENGGGVDKPSKKGALGVAQLMPDTALRYGLDPGDRVYPGKAIPVMGKYLKDLVYTFGEVSFAVSSYNTGEGTISKALRFYAKNHGRVETGDLQEAVESKNLGAVEEVIRAQRNYIETRRVSIYQVLTDPEVDREVISQIEEPQEARDYPFAVVAAAELLEEERLG